VLRDAGIVGGSWVSPQKDGFHTLYKVPVSGVTIIESLLVPRVGTGSGAPFQILFGTKRAFSLVVQYQSGGMRDGGAREPEVMHHFGLMVYGMKQIYSKEIGQIVFTPTSDAFNVSAA
jgi:hypothetical protein